MVTPSETKHLKLEVSNFGPIAEGTVELRPMTVFVGPSNTGKSYLATLIYALHRFFNAYLEDAGYVDEYGRLPRAKASDHLELSENDVTEILDWASEALEDMVQDITRWQRFRNEPRKPLELPGPIATLTRSAVGDAIHFADQLGTEIVRCFGVDSAQVLSRQGGNGSPDFSLLRSIPRVDRRVGHWGYTFQGSTIETKLTATVPNDLPLRVDSVLPLVRFARILSDERSGRRSQNARDLISVLVAAVVSDVVGPLSQPSYYLPADRAGVMHAHRVVVRALISSASRVGLRRDLPFPVLSGVLGDFLEQLLYMAESPRLNRGDQDDRLGPLEMKLLRGRVRIEQEQIGYPSFVYRPEGWEHDLPLMNTSSMVSELAPVALFLRHLVERGDTLIIEEPESHLHPEAQVEFTRVLAAAVKAGIRIIITTHSEWVLEELANLVRLSELPSERRKGIEAADCALSPDEVGAWFFDPGGEDGGSVVREIPLDVDSGTFPSGFGLVTADLYNRWVEITSRVENG